MQKNEKNLIILNCIFITALIISNIVAVKICSIFGLTVPSAVACYAVTFLCTDIIGELWGKAEANRTVRLGIVCQITASIMILIAQKLPYTSYNSELKQSFDIILGQNIRLVLASMAAYICSQSWDVFVFHKVKQKTGLKNKWLRNNLSTMTSQIIDTLIFIFIGFYGLIPNLLFTAVCQYIVKFILALIDTPFFYLFTRKNKTEENLLQ